MSKKNRVIMGIDAVFDEQTVSKGRQQFWTAEREENFLQQVSLKAQSKAKDIIQEAMQEAESIRSQAYQEGLNQAQQDIQKQVQQTRDSLNKQFHQLIDSLQKEKHKIWEDHSQDLVLLTKSAVEKVLNLELEAKRQESLTRLLEEGLETIDNQKGLTLKIHPQDGELLEDLLQQAQARFPALEKWRVKKDQKLEPGGVILETENGMVDNSLSTRWSEIMAVLEDLTLE